MELDSVQIGVDDASNAASAYTLLLGATPARVANGALRFQLRRGAVELEAGEPGLHSIRFTAAPHDDVSRWKTATFNGLRVLVTRPMAALQPAGAAPTRAAGLDHIVVHSPDLDRAVTLWRDRLGLRLALDREFPARGMRLLFFRSGGITLELAGALPQPPGLAGNDRFYGVTYRVSNLEAYHRHLTSAGVELSPIRTGHKPGTSVATVRSGTAGVPTLLLEDPSQP